MTENPLPPSVRQPIVDFIVIGAMKSGTTTLHAWLSEHPEVAMASWKEPAFFSRDDRWGRGADWYESLFEMSSTEQLRGDASTSYTDPRRAAVAARRIHEMAPQGRLIYLVRDPIERARSHYRHQVQRGRERRKLIEALADPEALYLSQSRYWSCLEPYTTLFGREQLLVIRLEDLNGTSEEGWQSILDHIGLQPIRRPTLTRNVTAKKRRYTWVMRKLWESGMLSPARYLPKSLRRAGARLLLRRDPHYEALLVGSAGEIPAELTDPVWADIAKLERWLAYDGTLWPVRDGS
jgi:hypothetical protein